MGTIMHLTLFSPNDQSPWYNPHSCYILPCMNPRWKASITDVEGVFLQGRFEDEEEQYIEVLDGIKEYYSADVVLKMNVLLY